MSVQAMAWVLNESPVRGGERLVLLSLANQARGDRHPFRAWPSVATIAREARMSERGVRQALERLRTAGAIRRCVDESGRPLTHEFGAEEHENPRARGKWRATNVWEICGDVLDGRSAARPSSVCKVNERMAPESGSGERRSGAEHHDTSPSIDQNLESTVHAMHQSLPLNDAHPNQNPSLTPLGNPKVESDLSDRVTSIANALSASIRAAHLLPSDTSRYAPSEAWRTSIERMLTEDQRDADLTLRLLDYLPACKSDFLRLNIRSGAALRQRWTDLLASAKRDGQPVNGSAPAARTGCPGRYADAAWAQAVDRLRGTVGDQPVQIWLEGSHLHGDENRTVLAVAPGCSEWVRDRLRAAIRQAVGDDMTIAAITECVEVAA